MLEELFFSGLIGSVQIDSVIPYILNMQVDIFFKILLHFLQIFPCFQLTEYGGMEESEEPIETEFEAVKEEIQ